MTDQNRTTDQPEQDLVEQFCETWRDWESRVLKIMHRHFSDLIPDGQTLKTMPQVARLLGPKGYWNQPSGVVKRLEQYQRLYEEIEAGGAQHPRELGRQQAQRLRAFMALDEREQRDLIPIASRYGYDPEQANMKLEALAEALRESADPSRNPFVDAMSQEDDTIIVGEREVRDRDEASNPDCEE